MLTNRQAFSAGGYKQKETKLGITAKKSAGGVEFAEWYTQVCTVAELISYYDVSGESLHCNPTETHISLLSQRLSKFVCITQDLTSYQFLPNNLYSTARVLQ